MTTPEPHLVVFDDIRARLWSPFAETRPVGELRFGASLLRERIETVSGLRCVAHVAGPALDLLTGSAEARECIEGGSAFEELFSNWERWVGEFEAKLEGILLYHR